MSAHDVLEAASSAELELINHGIVSSRTTLPNIELTAHHYYPDGTVEQTQPFVTEIEKNAMVMARDLGQIAMLEGNPPIGAVIINNETGQLWGDRTVDKSFPRLLQHAETRVYALTEGVLNDDLSACTLVTTAAPCTTCAPPYAEGKIGKIVYAAPRWAVLQVAGIMRSRSINMHELLKDGHTDTEVVGGFQAQEALESFAFWKMLFSSK